MRFQDFLCVTTLFIVFLRECEDELSNLSKCNFPNEILLNKSYIQNMNIFETERLILKQITARDAEDFYRIYTNPINMKFMGKAPDSSEFERLHIQKHHQLL